MRGDTPGVFGSLRELRPAGKVAAPMTLNMQGLEPAAPQDSQLSAANADDAFDAMQKGAMTPAQFVRILKNMMQRGIPIDPKYNDIIIDDLGVDPYSL